MNKELIKQVNDYLGRNDIDLLSKAIFNEVAFLYDSIKACYEDFDNIDLRLNNFEEITKDIMTTYYVNEGLTELVHGYLYDYVDKIDKGDNKNEG